MHFFRLSSGPPSAEVQLARRYVSIKVCDYVADVENRHFFSLFAVCACALRVRKLNIFPPSIPIEYTKSFHDCTIVQKVRRLPDNRYPVKPYISAVRCVANIRDLSIRIVALATQSLPQSTREISSIIRVRSFVNGCSRRWWRPNICLMNHVWRVCCVHAWNGR